MITQKTGQTGGGDPHGTSSTEESSGAEAFSQFVTCRVAGEEFAVDILSVQEIIRMVEITKVPKAPAFVEGVINLRGRIIPVLDLRRRMGIPESERTVQSRIVVVMVRGRVVGLVVDSVSEVLRIPKNAMEPAPSLGATVGAEFIQGVGRLEDRLLTLLDLKRLLLPGDATVLEAV